MSAKITPFRRTVVAGRLRRRKPCANNDHVGPLLNEGAYNDRGWFWPGYGECAYCSSTIHKSQIRLRSA